MKAREALIVAGAPTKANHDYGSIFIAGVVLSMAVDAAYMAVMSGDVRLPEFLRHTRTVAATLLACPFIVINIHQVSDGWRVYDIFAYLLSGLYFVLLYRAAINTRVMATRLLAQRFK